MEKKPLFRAKLEDFIIYVWAVGKWRPIRHYSPQRVPSANIQKEVLHSVWLNCGKSFDLGAAELHFIND
jgi:hypothetical protein